MIHCSCECFCMIPLTGPLCTNRRCQPPIILWCFPLLPYLSGHKGHREDRMRSEKDGRCRSSGFSLIWGPKRRQASQNESARGGEVWRKEWEERREEIQSQGAWRKVRSDKPPNLCLPWGLKMCKFIPAAFGNLNSKSIKAEKLNALRHNTDQG